MHNWVIIIWSSKETDYSNFPEEKWECLRSLANDWSIAMKQMENRSFMVVWDTEDYIVETEKHLNNKNL